MDAPLDESNINRFIKMLDRFVARASSSSSRTTSDDREGRRALWRDDGERGVSKLVAMRLASEKGGDGELRTSARSNSAQPQFAAEEAEERELAVSH
jgi:hypothetical protein